MKKIRFTIGLLFIFHLIIALAAAGMSKNQQIQPSKEENEIEVEIGDIIFRANSAFLASGRFYSKSGLPGHLALVVSEGTFRSNDLKMGNVEVIESAMLKRTSKQFQKDVSQNKAFENFGKYDGRRFILKMHLNEVEKQNVLKLANSKLGTPYSIFSGKDNTDKFQCASFVRWVILESSGFDLDKDGGFVFPNDILGNPRFDKPGDRIRF